MLKAIENLEHCRVVAADGQVGTVRDVYFDDDRWVVRYLVVETGSWLSARRVLISPYAVRFIDWQTRAVVVNLNREQVKNSPGMDTDKPVSRQQEEEFHRYYGYPQYWPYATHRAWGPLPFVEPPNPRDLEVVEDAAPVDHERAAADVHLRSSREVLRYHIQATDAFRGSVADLLFDEETWAIRYLVADIRSWFPGKQVLVERELIREVNWGEQSVSLALTSRELEMSPHYDRHHPPFREAGRDLQECKPRRTS
jgi:hypothetical protein